jgi:hypothetical protein
MALSEESMLGVLHVLVLVVGWWGDGLVAIRTGKLVVI